MGNFRSTLKNTLNYALGPILALLVWFVVLHMGDIPRYVLPSPVEVVVQSYEDRLLLLREGAYTLVNALSGLFGGVTVGLVLAVMMHRFVSVRNVMLPLTIVIQTVPFVFVYPLLLLWLGFGRFTIVFTVILTCFFPICFTLFQSLRSVPQDYEELFQGFNANYLQKLFYLYLPYSRPGFFAGLKISASYSVISAVISEWLGSSHGLGILMIRAYRSFSVTRVFAAIFLIVLMSLLILKLIALLEQFLMHKK